MNVALVTHVECSKDKIYLFENQDTVASTSVTFEVYRKVLNAWTECSSIVTKSWSQKRRTKGGNMTGQLPQTQSVRQTRCKRMTWVGSLNWLTKSCVYRINHRWHADLTRSMKLIEWFSIKNHGLHPCSTFSFLGCHDTPPVPMARVWGCNLHCHSVVSVQIFHYDC